MRLARCQPGSESQQFAMSVAADRSLRIHPRASPRLCIASRQQGACHCMYAHDKRTHTFDSGSHDGGQST